MKIRIRRGDQILFEQGGFANPQEATAYLAQNYPTIINEPTVFQSIWRGMGVEPPAPDFPTYFNNRKNEFDTDFNNYLKQYTGAEGQREQFAQELSQKYPEFKPEEINNAIYSSMRDIKRGEFEKDIQQRIASYTGREGERERHISELQEKYPEFKEQIPNIVYQSMPDIKGTLPKIGAEIEKPLKEHPALGKAAEVAKFIGTLPYEIGKGFVEGLEETSQRLSPLEVKNNNLVLNPNKPVGILSEAYSSNPSVKAGQIATDILNLLSFAPIGQTATGAITAGQTAARTGPKIIEALKPIARTTKVTVPYGAAYGAASALESGETEPSEILKQAAIGGATTGALGAATGLVGTGIGAAINKLFPNLSKKEANIIQQAVKTLPEEQSQKPQFKITPIEETPQVTKEVTTPPKLKPTVSKMEPVTIIPKELEPLAEEARKYKSAEEFINKIKSVSDEYNQLPKLKTREATIKQLPKEDQIIASAGILPTNVEVIMPEAVKKLTDFYNQATKGIKEVKPEAKPTPALEKLESSKAANKPQEVFGIGKEVNSPEQLEKVLANSKLEELQKSSPIVKEISKIPEGETKFKVKQIARKAQAVNKEVQQIKDIVASDLLKVDKLGLAQVAKTIAEHPEANLIKNPKEKEIVEKALQSARKGLDELRDLYNKTDEVNQIRYKKNYWPHIFDTSSPGLLQKYIEIAKLRNKNYSLASLESRIFKDLEEAEKFGFKQKYSQSLAKDFEAYANRIALAANNNIWLNELQKQFPKQVSVGFQAFTPEGKPFKPAVIPGLEGTYLSPELYKATKYLKPFEADTLPAKALNAWVKVGNSIRSLIFTLYPYYTYMLSGKAATLASTMGLKNTVMIVPNILRDITYMFSPKLYQTRLIGMKESGELAEMNKAGLNYVSGSDFGIADNTLSALNRSKNPAVIMAKAQMVRFKGALAQDLFRMYRAKYPNLPATDPRIQAGADLINAWLGSVDWKVAGISEIAHKAAQAVAFSPNLTTGEVIIGKRAIADWFTRKSASEEEKIFRRAGAKFAFLNILIGTSVAWAVINTLVQKLVTGNWPKDFKDFVWNDFFQQNIPLPEAFNSPTGITQILKLPSRTILGDVYKLLRDPKVFGLSRLQPILAIMEKEITGKDYYGNDLGNRSLVGKEYQISKQKNILESTLPPLAYQSLRYKEGKQNLLTTLTNILGGKVTANPQDQIIQKMNEAKTKKEAINNFLEGQKQIFKKYDLKNMSEDDWKNLNAQIKDLMAKYGITDEDLIKNALNYEVKQIFYKQGQEIKEEKLSELRYMQYMRKITGSEGLYAKFFKEHPELDPLSDKFIGYAPEYKDISKMKTLAKLDQNALYFMQLAHKANPQLYSKFFNEHPELLEKPTRAGGLAGVIENLKNYARGYYAKRRYAKKPTIINIGAILAKGRKSFKPIFKAGKVGTAYVPKTGVKKKAVKKIAPSLKV